LSLQRVSSAYSGYDSELWKPEVAMRAKTAASRTCACASRPLLVDNIVNRDWLEVPYELS
jgi:hypothetical protein